MFCTFMGRDAQGVFPWDKSQARALHGAVNVKGPLLTVHEGDQAELVVPAPLDALWVRHDQSSGGDSVQYGRYRLVPERNLSPSEERTQRLLSAIHDFEGEPGQASELIYPYQSPPKGKLSRPFVYWRWSELMRWLSTPEHTTVRDLNGWSASCIGALPKEYRAHVTLSSSFSSENEMRVRSALDGHLFGTWNQRYQDVQGRDYRLWAEMNVDHEHSHDYDRGWAHLGGEKRMVELSPSSVHVPQLSDELRASLSDQRVVRVVLLSPAIFTEGDRPTTLLEGGHRLIAQSVGRPQVVSGWDVAKSKPKPTRRMAPAGSVYWVELAEGTSAAEWAASRFMTCISDELTDQRHGFGLCVVGVA
jgi:CRISPR-associated protein Cmr3